MEPREVHREVCGICICWIEVYFGEIDLADRLAKGEDTALTTAAAQKRLELAHQRYLGPTPATPQPMADLPLQPVPLK